MVLSYTLSVISTGRLFALLSSGCTASELENEMPILEGISLSDNEFAELMAAPGSYLVDEPSAVLLKAMEAWSVQKIRADKMADGSSPVVQGWIYFEPTEEHRPIIVCISQSKDRIKWMHCQEETHRLDSE